MMESIIRGLFSTEGGTVWLVVKWAAIVLAAGFIGQFGKAFASYLMGRARKNRATSLEGPPETGTRESAQETLRNDVTPGRIPAPENSVMEPSAREEDEKKLLKARAKQQKKTLKNLKKMFR
jgi:hypothetical protein